MKRVLVTRAVNWENENGTVCRFGAGYEGPMDEEGAMHFARAGCLSILGDEEDFADEPTVGAPQPLPIGLSRAGVDVEEQYQNSQAARLEADPDAKPADEEPADDPADDSGDEPGDDDDDAGEDDAEGDGDPAPADDPKPKSRTRTRKPRAPK